MKVWLITFLCLVAFGTAAAEEFSLAEAEAAWNRGDSDTALRHWQALSERGDIIASNNLGHLYENGIGVEKDFAKAIVLYRQAADAGFAVGQFNMGEAYFKGRGAKADPVEALKWYMLAANGGDSDAVGAVERLQQSLGADEQGEAALRMMQWRQEFRKRQQKRAPAPQQ